MANGNIFATSLHQTADLFAPYLAGELGAPALVVGSRWPKDEMRHALESSFAALGHADGLTLYACTNANEGDDGQDAATLDANSLYTLVEGADPLFIVATDAQAGRLLCQAYRQQEILNASARLNGRTVVVFSDFSTMLDDTDEKQRAWKLLKHLPQVE